MHHHSKRLRSLTNNKIRTEDWEVDITTITTTTTTTMGLDDDQEVDADDEEVDDAEEEVDHIMMTTTNCIE